MSVQMIKMRSETLSIATNFKSVQFGSRTFSAAIRGAKYGVSEGSANLKAQFKSFDTHLTAHKLLVRNSNGVVFVTFGT